MSGVESYTGKTVLEGTSGLPVLLVELDGHPAQVEEDAAKLLQEALGEQVCKDLEKQHEGASLRAALNEVLFADTSDSIPDSIHYTDYR